MAIESHYLANSLGKDQRSRARWAKSPSGRAVIFIHGYGGDALKTWSEFDSRLPRKPGFEGDDLVFYGHNSLYDELIAGIGLLYQFLDGLLTRPSLIINPAIPSAAARAADFKFSRIRLVAHSLGAVLCRGALLRARRDHRPWRRRCRLYLFAPAHTGARIKRMALEAQEFSFLRLFSMWIRFQSPLIDQLGEGSRELKWLLRATRKALRSEVEDNSALVARRVCIAERERVVSNIPFADDPDPIALPNTDHRSVCKPRGDFLQPLEMLE